MKPTQVSIFKLNGNKKAIKEYAENICGNPFTNAYVMAFDKNNDICWCFQGSNEVSEVNEDMTWEDVVRVEIYDRKYKNNQVVAITKVSYDLMSEEYNMISPEDLAEEAYLAIFCDSQNNLNPQEVLNVAYRILKDFKTVDVIM